MDNGRFLLKRLVMLYLMMGMLYAAVAERSRSAYDVEALMKKAGIHYTQSDYHGFTRLDFKYAERDCHIVKPKAAAEGVPWIWRARFFGKEPQLEIALLKQGYHVTYCDVAAFFGCPEAVGYWDAFYQLTQKLNFSTQAVLEGMSRGGLIVYNWAAKNPEKVAVIYADAPVCDFNSWPGGKGKGKGSKNNWKKCLARYKITEEEAKNHKLLPINLLVPIAKAEVPIIHVSGLADKVVPFDENGAIIEARYKALGGTIKMINKEDCGHHPHSLKDPTPILEFILKHNVTKSNSKEIHNHSQKE